MVGCFEGVTRPPYIIVARVHAKIPSMHFPPFHRTEKGCSPGASATNRRRGRMRAPQRSRRPKSRRVQAPLRVGRGQGPGGRVRVRGGGGVGGQ